MKVWIFVEGSSDVKALSALLNGWKQNLSTKGWGVQIIPLDSKSKYFRKIGSRATEKLANDAHDLVVGLPDLYPNRDYADTEYKHKQSARVARRSNTLGETAPAAADGQTG